MKARGFRFSLLFAMPILASFTLSGSGATYQPLSPSASPRVESIGQQLAHQSNLERVRNGLAPLKLNPNLSAAAAWLARDMATKGYFEHVDRHGRGLRERLELFDYLDWRGVAENIAAGVHTPSGAVASWMDSPGHRVNLLNANFSEIGAGYHESRGSEWKRYWVQTFGNRLGYYPVIINNEAQRTSSAQVTLYIHGEGWARRMRFSNDRAVWSRWEEYSPTRKWQLAPGSGPRTVYVQIVGESVHFSSHDSIDFIQSSARNPSRSLP